MKELRAFFELTSLCLLPVLVLLFAFHHEPVDAAASSGAEPWPVSTGSVSAAAPRMAVISAGYEGEAEVCTAQTGGDSSVSVTIRTGEQNVKMSLRDYLIGVVAAEMPASFCPEALQAQAVAARTDTLWRMQLSRPHTDADCCTDPGCCKAYADADELRRRWGADYEKWRARVEAAVDATDGEVLTYGGEPIFAAFHAASAGSTECSENVWLSALPYLRSVSTAETESDVPRFRETVSVSADELRSLLLSNCGDITLPDDPAEWLTEAEWSEAGRLLRVKAGDVSLSGTSLRSLLGLRSTAVQWTVAEGVFSFETLGYGHGVGMSQYGAEVMAEAGESCRSILLHYYSGAELKRWEDIFAA